MTEHDGVIALRTVCLDDGSVTPVLMCGGCLATWDPHYPQPCEGDPNSEAHCLCNITGGPCDCACHDSALSRSRLTAEAEAKDQPKETP